jgi:pimeloyl-[acyl-carrier protein] methyl ester esterase
MNPCVFDDLSVRLRVRYDVRAVALPGYGNSPAIAEATLHGLAASLSSCSPDRCFVAGWSLGAQVALAWARLAREQVEALVLLGATPCFVQREDWETAIPPGVLQEFAAALEYDRVGTLMRFVTLQSRGDEAAAHVLRELRAALKRYAGAEPSMLRNGLTLLLETDLRDTLPLIAQPALVIHGECDTLAPLAAAVFLAKSLPAASLLTLAGAAHAPFVSQPAAVSRAMLDFFDER